MLKKSLVIIFAVIFIFQFATALETNIKINTLGNHIININFLNPDRASEGIISFESQTLQSGSGEVTTTFVSEEEKFDLSIFLMEGSKKVVYEEFKGLINGEDFSLILLPGIPKESMIEFDKDVVETVVENSTEVMENESIQENETTIENESNEEANISQENSTEQITGEITNTNSNESSKSKNLFSRLLDSDVGSNPYSKFILYFVIAFALLGAGFFLKGTIKKKVFSNKKKKDNNDSPPIVVKKEENKKEDEDKKDDSDENEDEDSYVNDAEIKMKQAETEMRIARDARKLKEDRKRLMKDKDYLKRLKESRDKEQ